ncbi:MAG: type IV secretory system conjugative DNA transfer family protein, partial [Lactococcus garvieae]
MNTLYKQWKKWMAEPKILKRVGVAIMFVTFLLFNFVYNVLLLFLYATKGSTFESFGQNWAYFKYLFSQTSLLTLFPKFQKVSYWLFLLLVLSVTGFLTWRLLYNARRSFRDLNKGSKGTAKWTTLDEIREQYPKVPLDKNIEFDERPGLPIAIDPNRKEMYIDPDNTNSKTFGGTQTGKTQYITYPLLDLMIRSKQPDSGLINDIKGDITRRTWLHPLANKKFHLKAFNLVNPMNSLRFNPIHGVAKYWESDTNRAQRMLTTVSHDFYYEPDAKDPIWNLGAESIFKTVTVLVAEIALKEKHPEWINITSLTNFARVLTREKDKDEGGNTLLDRYVEALDSKHLASKYYAQALQG